MSLYCTLKLVLVGQGFVARAANLELDTGRFAHRTFRFPVTGLSSKEAFALPLTTSLITTVPTMPFLALRHRLLPRLI